ncbi:DUF1569 domain-containing protein [Sinomicrobium sp. M5D2P9]
MNLKSVFQADVRRELISRINSLTPESKAQWGKMNVYQMTRHCTIWDEWIQGKNNVVYKQDLLGRIFGKMALKSNVKNDKPLKRGMPAGKGFIIKEKEGDVEKQKKIWAGLVSEYAHFNNPRFIHDFFGKMSEEQIGIFVYKHTDHHLRQFGC